jgi:hypothetical protein
MDLDSGGEGERWMTFLELSQARGVSLPSARKLVRRHKWRRQAGNDGLVRILVPREALEDRPKPSPGPDRGSGRGADHGADLQDISHAVSALQAAVASLTEARASAEKRADQAESALELARSREESAIAALRERADADSATIARLQDRVEVLTRRLGDATVEAERAHTAAQEAQTAAEELRQAEAARAGQGRWRRLRAAWRRQ